MLLKVEWIKLDETNDEFCNIVGAIKTVNLYFKCSLLSIGDLV
jgi:hypothetical protein